MTKGFRNIVFASGAVISIFTFFSMNSQIELYNNLRLERDNLQQQLISLENDISKLNYEIELINTDEHMENVAREKLGYIKSNEIVFREKTK